MCRVARLALALTLAAPLSCADMPTAPRPILTVSGQITDRDGPGIEQVYVTFVSLDPRDRPVIIFSASGKRQGPAVHSIQTVTDGSGRYRVRIPAGPYDVYLEPQSGYPSAQLRSVTVGPDRNEVSYRYSGARVTGSITGPGGMVLGSGAMIAAGADYSTSTLRAGRYSLLVPPGIYDFRAFGRTGNIAFPSIRLEGVSVDADTTIDVVLDGVKVTGTITGPGGDPLYHIRVETFGEDYLEAYTEADGVYTMYARPGVYDFRVRPWDYEWLAGRAYSSINVSGPMTLNFDLSGVQWDGTVRRLADSTGVEEADVVGYAVDGFWRVLDRTDSLGAFHLVVEPGVTYDFHVFTSTQGHPMGRFKATADTTFSLYIDVPPLP